ncbi:endonuclease/exonuclease/phosphatase family protein [Bacteroides sp.]
MKKNILLSGILLLVFSYASAQDYHDDVIVLDSVKVMSFNIRFNNPNDSLDTAWEQRREPCARMMAQHRPDVVGMQEPRNEMWQQIFDMLPDYAYYRIETNDTLPDSRTGGILLLYLREKYSVVRSGHFWLSATPDIPSQPWNSTDRHYRAALWLQLKDRKNRKEFYIVTTHLPYKKDLVDTEVRARCAALINSKMKLIAGEEATIFVTGDMNASYSSDDPRRESLTPFYDWFASAREDASKTDDHSSFNGFGRVSPLVKGKNLDHIFYRNACPVVFETIDKPVYGVRWVSDHYPIICTFTY